MLVFSPVLHRPFPTACPLSLCSLWLLHSSSTSAVLSRLFLYLCVPFPCGLVVSPRPLSFLTSLSLFLTNTHTHTHTHTHIHAHTHTSVHYIQVCLPSYWWCVHLFLGISNCYGAFVVSHGASSFLLGWNLLSPILNLLHGITQRSGILLTVSGLTHCLKR